MELGLCEVKRRIGQGQVKRSARAASELVFLIASQSFHSSAAVFLHVASLNGPPGLGIEYTKMKIVFNMIRNPVSVGRVGLSRPGRSVRTASLQSACRVGVGLLGFRRPR